MTGRRRSLVALLAVVVALIGAACEQESPEVVAQRNTPAATVVPTAVPTPTVIPTTAPTPTVVAPTATPTAGEAVVPVEAAVDPGDEDEGADVSSSTLVFPTPTAVPRAEPSPTPLPSPVPSSTPVPAPAETETGPAESEADAGEVVAGEVESAGVESSEAGSLESGALESGSVESGSLESGSLESGPAGTVTAEASEPDATAEVSSIQLAAARSTRVPSECPDELVNQPITCEFIWVPEDDENPANGRVVKLFVATIDNGGDPALGPLVYLQGGPGVGAVQGARAWVGLDLDVILIDQRGTGFSSPSLDCTATDALFDDLAEYSSRDSRGTQLDLDAEETCREQLERQGVNIGVFTSEHNADDVAVIREVMGYPQWNLYGASYGSRLALTIMRDHPEGVRSVVVDAVLPPDVDYFASIPANIERALDELASACREVNSCSENYGDLWTQLNAASDLLDREPQRLQAARVESGEQYTVYVDGPTFRNYVFNQMYIKSAIPRLPRLIWQAAQGDVVQITADSQARYDPEAFDFAEAMYWSVFCHDELAFHDENFDQVVIDRHPEAFERAHEYDNLSGICAEWEGETATLADAVENEPVRSDIPALVFSGRFDPITPPEWAFRASASLTNSQHIEFASNAHGSLDPCGFSIAEAFFRDPAAEVDTSCAEIELTAFD